jgi:sirohydrochlorin cobaltochelatase
MKATRMNHSTTPQAVILFAHGSRDPLWHQPMQQVAARARSLNPQVVVTCAYLELTSPDLPSCADDMVEQGIQAITVVPMFLGVGRHAREDLPVLMQRLKAKHPQVQFKLHAAIGEHPKVVDLLAQIALS